MLYSNANEMLSVAISNFFESLRYNDDDGIIIRSKDTSDIGFHGGFVPDINEFDDEDFINLVKTEHKKLFSEKRTGLIHFLDVNNIDDDEVITELIVEIGQCMLVDTLSVFEKMVDDVDLSQFNCEIYNERFNEFLNKQENALLEMIETKSLESLVEPCRDSFIPKKMAR